MQKLRVELGDRSYPIIVGTGILANSGPILSRLGFETAPVIVTNSRVQRLHGDKLLSSLQRTFGPVPVIRIGDGERFKNQHSVEKIYEGLFRARANRRSWIVAFGGGVIGDIAGFAAATFMRGIRFVGIPTTLLAQVDSSVGGKVGINCPQGKNLIGSFHQPGAVISDTGTLKTLPARELASGIYEIIKYGAIRSDRLLQFLSARLDVILKCESPAINRVIIEAIRIKAAVVGQDERESADRIVLNFGHTFGHALEAATSYRRFKHGEAVAWGMLAAAKLSGIEQSQAERLQGLIHRVESLPGLRGISVQRVWDALLHDKKSLSGNIRMVLLTELGCAEVGENLDPERLRKFIAAFLANPGILPVSGGQ
jgi:3-dehydroquinate synthase